MQRETIVRFIEKRSDVPRVLRNDDRFRKEVNDLVRLLLQPKMLRLIAIHEAGHEIYYHKAGFATFRYAPPTVVYRKDNKEKPFDGQLARIIPEGYRQPEHDDWLFYLAKGYASGGECSTELTTTDYGGDIRDRQWWNEMCAYCHKDSTLTEKEIDAVAEDLWGKAQKAVGKELRDSSFLRTQIQSKTKEVIPKLFPWTKYA